MASEAAPFKRRAQEAAIAGEVMEKLFRVAENRVFLSSIRGITLSGCVIVLTDVPVNQPTGLSSCASNLRSS
jgi:hypothetical protein